MLKSSEEHTQPTPHGQVMRVLGLRQPLPPADLEHAVAGLLEAAEEGDRTEMRRRLWDVARDGSAPPAPRLPAPGGSASTSPFSSFSWSGPPATTSLRLATAGALTNGEARVALPAARAPIQVLAERASARTGQIADRLLAVEPWYVVPAAAILLAYPNRLVWPAVALILLPMLLRALRFGYPVRATSFYVPIGLLAAGAVVGMAVTSNPLQGGIRLSGLLAALALYWLIVHHATDQARLRRTLGLVLAACAVGSVALLVVAMPYLSWGAAGGPLDGLVAATDPLRQIVIGSDEALQRYRLRASGVGALATFGMALAIGPAISAARQRTRLTVAGLAAGFLLVNALSGSESSLVSILALIVVLFGLRYGWPLVAVPVVLAGLWAVADRGLLGPAAPDALPISTKLRFWQNAAAMLHDFAFTGVGLGLRPVRDTYEAYFLALGPTFSHAHNAYVQAYLEQGLAGCVGLVALTLALVFNARRTVAAARTPLVWSVAISGGGAADRPPIRRPDRGRAAHQRRHGDADGGAGTARGRRAGQQPTRPVAPGPRARHLAAAAAGRRGAAGGRLGADRRRHLHRDAAGQCTLPEPRRGHSHPGRRLPMTSTVPTAIRGCSRPTCSCGAPSLPTAAIPPSGAISPRSPSRAAMPAGTRN